MSGLSRSMTASSLGSRAVVNCSAVRTSSTRPSSWSSTPMPARRRPRPPRRRRRRRSALPVDRDPRRGGFATRSQPPPATSRHNASAPAFPKTRAVVAAARARLLDDVEAIVENGVMEGAMVRVELIRPCRSFRDAGRPATRPSRDRRCPPVDAAHSGAPGECESSLRRAHRSQTRDRANPAAGRRHLRFRCAGWRSAARYADSASRAIDCNSSKRC